MEEILLIDKPKGITSHDVLRILQKLYKLRAEGHARTLTFSLPKRGDDGQKNIDISLTSQLDACFEYYSAHNPSTKKLVCGHAGTLDPLASGLMIVGVGAGTKKLTEYVGLPKTYKAEVLLGTKTDTGDIEGELTEEAAVPTLDIEAVKTVLQSMVGVLRIPAPVYSAIKQGGEPLYKKVRRGEEVEPPLRDMEVLNVSGVSVDGKCVHVTWEVSSGTYVRSLAEELGRRLRIPATLKNLRRTKVGEFRVGDAETLK